jgi:hypothetical protein
MSLDEFIFSQIQRLQWFEEWWKTLPESEIEMPIGDWDDQFLTWLQSEINEKP